MIFIFWRYVILLLFFQAAIPSLSCAESIKFGRYHALLIANENYKNGWKTLNTPHNDVYDLKEVLKDKYGFSVADIDVLHDATRDQIIDKLENLKTKLTDQDNLLIYYAGHGKAREDGGYWIGINATKESRSRWLHFRTVLDLIDYKKGMKARHVVIVADSCHAGAIFKYRGDDESAEKDNNETTTAWLIRMHNRFSRTALTSGGIEEVIDSVGNSRNSIFAWELINRLKNNDKILGMRTLYDQINKEVHVRALNVLGEEAQAPEYAPLRGTGHNSGDFIFVPKGMNMKTIEYHPSIQHQITTKGDNNNSYEVERLRAEVERLRSAERSKPKSYTSESYTKPVVARKMLTKKEQTQALYEWQQDIRYSSSSRIVEQFLQRYPTGSHVPDAQRKLKELRDREL